MKGRKGRKKGWIALPAGGLSGEVSYFKEEGVEEVGISTVYRGRSCHLRGKKKRGAFFRRREAKKKQKGATCWLKVSCGPKREGKGRGRE